MCVIMSLVEADAVVCIIAQFANDWSKNIAFDSRIIVDEDTKISEA